MKELSIEDKAKAYDEAKINCSRLWECGEITRENYEYIFPEVKESGDERIRNIIKQSLKSYFEGKLSIGTNDVDYAMSLSWLEKHGSCQNDVNYNIAKNEDERIRGAIIDHLKDNNLTEWASWLEKHGEKKFNNTDFSDLRTWKYIADYVLTKWCGIGQYLDNPYLTTIAEELQKKYYLEQKQGEQKPADETPYPETLEKAIDLYYYSYGNGEGEFEHLSLEKFRDIVHTFISDYGQKPAWSEDDEKFFKTALWHISYSISNGKSTDEHCDTTDWFKSLKERYTWKPSDEYIQALDEVYKTHGANNVCRHILLNLMNDLKKLKG